MPTDNPLSPELVQSFQHDPWIAFSTTMGILGFVWILATFFVVMSLIKVAPKLVTNVMESGQKLVTAIQETAVNPILSRLDNLNAGLAPLAEIIPELEKERQRRHELAGSIGTLVGQQQLMATEMEAISSNQVRLVEQMGQVMDRVEEVKTLLDTHLQDANR